jgi:hypothetical protein
MAYGKLLVGYFRPDNRITCAKKSSTANKASLEVSIVSPIQTLALVEDLKLPSNLPRNRSGRKRDRKIKALD